MLATILDFFGGLLAWLFLIFGGVLLAAGWTVVHRVGRAWLIW